MKLKLALAFLLALTGIASAQTTTVPGTLLQYPITFGGAANFASTFQISGNTMTFPAGAATIVGSGIHNTLGTGATSDTVLISTNTGFSNIFEITNSGTASNVRHDCAIRS